MVKEEEHSQTVAIVGVAFRFPGDLGHESDLWRALIDGRDLVTQIDASRWAADELRHPKRSEAGRSITFSAGVLSRIDEFDAAFFGISPREAELMDPQQRLLLELSWEAMENAGIKPSTLAGSDCAVYVGISGLDYGMRILDDLSSMAAHSMTGNTMSVAANRLSYVFDLHGPSLAVDTACSSSLVALHHACASLRSGLAPMALVGGVNLLLHPYPFVGFTKASMLSSQGRCRAFAEGGDGYVRAEGAAVLLLKPLRQAQEDGDRIYAVIRASGVNADGARKSGLTIPSVDGQTELMRRVLDQAGLRPDDVDYVEAHGTGTKIGDPIESRAIGAVYGKPGRRAKPLAIGSIKSNLGHMEPASGMAGLVKALLAIRHRTIPPTIHADRLNPAIDFDALNLHVARQAIALTDLDRPMRVGVNSFGFGGVNAHVILEEHIQEPVADAPALADAEAGTQPFPLVLSAQTEDALRDLSRRYLPPLADPAQRTLVAQAAWFDRDWLQERLAIPDVRDEQALRALQRFAQGEDAPGVIRERALADSARLAFVYSGNGAQWVGMGRQLMQCSPVFAQALQDVDKAIRAHDGPSVLGALADEDPASMDDTAVAQPALFAVQVSMTELLRSLGLDADAAMGHSVGEIAAAWAVGVMSLNTAARVIVARSRAQALTRGTGRMAAVGLGLEAMRAKLGELGLAGAIEVAAVNSPRSVTVSAAKPALDALCDALRGSSIFYRELDLDYAFHSRCMDPIEKRLTDNLAGLRLNAARGRFFSTVTGDALDAQALGASYWWHNVRDPVQFGPAIRNMAEAGYRVFIEIGPHAILQRYIAETLDAQKIAGRSLGTARRQDESLQSVQETVMRAALLGAPVDFRAYFAQPARRRVQLPNYPWQRQRHWHARTAEGYSVIERRAVHPLLGYRLKELRAGWENHLDPIKHPWLADHKVGHAIVLPGAAYVDMALAAAREWFGGDSFVVEGLDILAPVVFDGEHARTVRLVFTPTDLRFRIEGRQRQSSDEWTVHAQGRLLGHASRPWPQQPRIPVVQADAQVVEGARLYALASALGLGYGPRFRGLRTLHVDPETLCAELEWAPPHAPDGAHLMHPAVLDQCFQAVFGWFGARLRQNTAGLTFLPVGMGRVTLWTHTSVSSAQRLRARLVRQSPRSVLVDFELLDHAGAVIAEVRDARFRAAVVAAPEKPAAAWAMTARLAPLERDPTLGALPTCSTLRADIEQAWTDLDTSRLKRYFDEVAPLVEILPAAFARDAVVALASPRRTLDDAAVQRLRDAHPLLRWLVELLRSEGLLRQEQDAWLIEDQELPPTRAIWESALAESPQALPELLRIARVGERLPRLAGGDDIAGELTPSGTDELLTAQAPAYAAANHAVVQAVSALVRRWPAGRRIRILDIGPGESATRDHLQSVLPTGRVDYVLARSDAEGLAHLQARFADDPGVSATALHPETFSIDAQDSTPARFDVVLITHALHRIADPVRALAEIAQRMSDDAVLLLAERRPDRASNLLHGIDTGWWHESGSGTHASLLPPPAWERLLRDAGWDDVQTLADPLGSAAGLGSFVVLAKPKAQVADVDIHPQTWTLLTRHRAWQPLAEVLEGDLAAAGHRVSRSDALFADLQALDNLIVFADAVEPAASASSVAQSCEDLRELLLGVAAHKPDARVWIVTRGGALVTDPPLDTVCPAAAAIWGLVRVILNESAQLQIRLIDAQGPLDDPNRAARLLHELTHSDGEQEIILASSGRYVPRMHPADLGGRASMNPAKHDAWRLDFTLPGQLRNLHWRAAARRQPADDEIEIEACAAALNFRDVMYAMGLLSDEALEQGFAGAALGLEVAGRVSRCGAKVTRFKPGDEVLAFAGASFASHVVVPERAAALKPERWSFEEAATVPTVFFTVWYALHHLARLQPGERVLIHGAAGGVGIAAIQVARQLGAEIFATAGTAEKREFASMLGADHVLDSRSLGFDDAILDLTQGEGIDVVLNSLAGEAIQRNLRVLRPFGRFIELGKRDFYENTAIGLRPFRNNISYFGVDADQLMKVRPDLASRVFAEVMAQFAEGKLSPLPYRSFSADHVVDAFRQMQQARHIGKLVVDLRQAPRHVEHDADARPHSFAARRDGTYVVTGGLSGFGLATAAWLADKGAGHLVLLGRRGVQTPGIEGEVQRLQERGASVHVMACDVADRQQLTDVLQQIAQTLPPVRGIVHAAMVLDDALLANLDAERFRRVLAPKLDGAWNLHEATRTLPLEFFVLYSSATTYLGNPGQANYVAANATIEALARLRRQQGLAASVVAWGPIGDVGVLTANAAAREGLEARLGAPPLESGKALAVLDRMLAQDASGLAVMDFEWSSLQRALPSAACHRFDALRRASGTGLAEQGDADVRAHLAQLPPDEARRAVADMLAAEVADILRLPAGGVPFDRSLNDLGMDSLMAVELALALEKRFAVTLPPMLINENPTIERIAERLLSSLFGGAKSDGDQTQALVESMLAQHAEPALASEVAGLVEQVRENAGSGTRP